MEAPDAVRQSVGLPSINHMDANRFKREENDYQRKLSNSAMVSPLHPYPGPSHSHNNHQSPPASAVPGSLAGLLSPPESRRTSGDEKDVHKPAARQSLPSISEALGAEQSLPYPGPVPPPPSAAAPPSQHYLPASATTSPSDSRKRPLPSLHPIKTTQSPPPVARPNPPYSSYPPAPSPAYEPPAPQRADPMNHQYGYPPYASYPSSAPAPTGPPTAYPPSTSTYSAPSRYYPTSLRDNNETHLEEKKLNRASLAPYGESVKRHLDSFDLEASLNEMADGCGRISEFSKVYRQRAHENQRIGMTPQSIPRLEDIDDMIKQGERVQMSLQRMRDVVFNHHQASIAEPPREAHYRRANGYDHETSSSYGDDMKSNGGFAGADNKTRKRGRAAPPGRCHSCNRAETPEWRRGPDGARTLCNACGLHYAKLTRKIGKDAMTSSNLRPKSIDHGSPAI
ncbi:hypothetical protein EKO04_009185 [Ascochyta lentis]|uniref:GATA-type domain-containing protein n=1 Tax=Ascochyta lentis TaxID=205686 RepID=A0A8H7IZE2_9PLEO|nr:hypothetical protein EKO04_009185 [Ascochyta lentis]